MVAALAGTTGLLLLVVFTIVNVACLVLRKDTSDPRRSGRRRRCRCSARWPARSWSAPWARDREDWVQYKIAAGLLGLGVVLWVLTWFTNRGVRAKKTGFRDPDELTG